MTRRRSIAPGRQRPARPRSIPLVLLPVLAAFIAAGCIGQDDVRDEPSATATASALATPTLEPSLTAVPTATAARTEAPTAAPTPTPTEPEPSAEASPSGEVPLEGELGHAHRAMIADRADRVRASTAPWTGEVFTRIAWVERR